MAEWKVPSLQQGVVAEWKVPSLQQGVVAEGMVPAQLKPRGIRKIQFYYGCCKRAVHESLADDVADMPRPIGSARPFSLLGVVGVSSKCVTLFLENPTPLTHHGL